MTNIKIGVTNREKNDATTMWVPDDVPVKALILAMVQEMNLRSKSQDRHWLCYHLGMKRPGGELERLEHCTLEENGVQGNDNVVVLRLTTEKITRESDNLLPVLVDRLKEIEGRIDGMEKWLAEVAGAFASILNSPLDGPSQSDDSPSNDKPA